MYLMNFEWGDSSEWRRRGKRREQQQQQHEDGKLGQHCPNDQTGFILVRPKSCLTVELTGLARHMFLCLVTLTRYHASTAALSYVNFRTTAMQIQIVQLIEEMHHIAMTRLAGVRFSIKFPNVLSTTNASTIILQTTTADYPDRS